MRLSTQAFFAGSLAAMQKQSTALAELQNQVALGQRVNTPADDPIAAVHIIELERALSESAQFGKNSTLLRNRLQLEEQALADSGQILHRVRELALQASNIGALSDSDRRSIAAELQSKLSELQDIANRQDGNGEYLFGGFITRDRPFTGGGAVPVEYEGDQGSRLLQISSTQRVPDSHSGHRVFMDITEGNGTFVTAVAATNAGSGTIDVGTAVTRAPWAGDYTITFTSATAWIVTDSATPANTVATGTYTAGAPIEFDGVRVEIAGEPAANDSFSVRQSGSESIFTTVAKMVAALREPTGAQAAHARLSSALEGSLQQIDQASDHLLAVRAEVGARLATADAADDSRHALDIDLETSLSELRDLDYGAALTRLNQQLVGLQAAQLSYSQISRLSLFDYLR